MSKSRFLLPLILLGPFVLAGGIFLALQRSLPPVDNGSTAAAEPPQKTPETPRRAEVHGEATSPGSPASHLSGPIGHLDASQALVRGFLEQAPGHHAFLDLTFDPASFDGSIEDGYFVVWDQCQGLLPDEVPSADKCSGWSIRLDSETDIPLSEVFHQHDGFPRLRGTFRLGDCDGPHQGLIGCLLVPEPAPGRNQDLPP